MIKQGLKMGLYALGIYLIMCVMCVMVCLQIGVEMYWLQIVLNGAILAGMFLALLMEGGKRGRKACDMSARAEKLRSDGRKFGKEIIDQCFDRRAAAVAFAVCMVPLMTVSVVNLIVEPYYPEVIIEESVSKEEQEAILQMTQEQLAQMEAESEEENVPVNWVNAATRVVYMPYVFVYTPYAKNPHGLNLWFLLFAVIPALPMPIGYLCGPRLRRKKLMEIEKGKKRKLKKLKVRQIDSTKPKV